MNDLNEIKKLIKWARKQGALLIKVNGVELTFPPDIDSRLPHPLPISSLQTSNQQDAKKAEEFIRAPSALDDPDYYIREQDSWISHSRPPPLG